MAIPQGLRVLIVDDEPLAVERMQILCAQQEVQVVGTAHDGNAALRLVAAFAPDVVLLDIAMPGLDGMAVAHALQDRPERLGIVFVTAFDQFAVAAFDVAATDYLLKPVTPERLRRALARVREQLPGGTPPSEPMRAAGITEFWVPHGPEVVRVAASDIDLIEAERDYMRLHIGARSFLLHQTISELERRLDPEKFLRLHRSTIVPRDRIAGLRHDGAGNWQAVLKGGRAIRIGRTFLARARGLMTGSRQQAGCSAP